ncbi:condensin complex subunit 1-like [Vespa mandarinia]|uniref:condensin complex subunit 1-like n=1 Tax=Vespa mandarinia TaxID=7446 RepID=UPI00161FC075|nr:condensin complex subunit 1-like [Vespa mandarinia]
MIKDFIIPLNKDELLTSHAGQYSVEKIIPPGMVSKALDASRITLQADGASFILTCFDTFFAVLVHGNKIELQFAFTSFRRIFKGIQILVTDLEKIFDQGKEIEEEERPKLLCVNKMLAYLVSQFICHINEQISKNSSNIQNSRKKNAKTDEEDKWDDERQKVLELIYRWLQLPLQKIWKPSIVEDSFVTVLSQICYNVLEHCRDIKQKHTRQTIFEILGTLIKKYNHGIICIVRIVQLVKLFDTLPAYMATGVVYMDVECGCNGLLKQIIKELDQTEPAEAESRNISAFLENIATLKPDIVLPIMNNILEYLTNEYYIMRNCAIGIIGTIVPTMLTNEDLTPEQKEQRDECLNSLFDHILDCNAYVRSKVLHVWQNLSCEGAIPLAMQGKLLNGCISRLQDKSANVRKQALQLLRTLLQSNPFAAKLEEIEFSKSVEREKIKLKELQTLFACNSEPGDIERLELWNTLLPDIKEAIKEIIESDDENRENDKEKTDDDVDPSLAFEKIRQLILNGKVFDAVSYLWTICTKLKDTPKIENLSSEAKKECLFTFLLKIFMESEDRVTKENVSQEKKKQKEEIKAQKRLINYLENSLEFATKLKNAIPLVEALLFSTTSSDAVEACTLLGIACQFGVTGATASVNKALFQVLHNDQSVRRNLAMVYKQIYLDNTEPQKSARQRAITCVKSLINLVKKLQPGQSSSLEELIRLWYSNKEISEETLQVLWEIFSMKLPDTTPIESRAALILIMMIGQTESGVIVENLDVLVKIGLGPRAKNDLLLARDICRTLQKIKQENQNIEAAPIRYPNNHNMFKEIIILLKDNFCNLKENGYISFATDAINVIYKLANQPQHLIKNFLLDTYKIEQFTAENDKSIVISSIVLSKLLHIVGHVAIREMVHLDTEIYKELKRRNNIRDLKKNKNLNKDNSKQNVTITSSNRSVRNKENLQEDNGEDALEGAADDTDAEFINTALESEIVTGNGLLTKFVPIVLDVCQHPEKYGNENLQAAGTLALCKMMTVSSVFCETYLQLLVTILERSPYPGIRANVLIGLSDLTTRFPNQVEPWTKHIYGRLRDENKHVRSTCVRVLSNLIMREMVRVKGQVSELALCIIDEDIQIQQDTKHFFKELSQRGYALYNVIPDILSRLSDPQINLNESHFQEIFGFILNLVQHKKQIDTIIEKICARFKLATTERQWCDLSYCLSILPFSVKSIRRLIESLPLLKDKIHHKQVLKTLQGIIEQTKKKSDTKSVCLELEEKIKELLEGSENTETNDNILMPPPKTLLQQKSRMGRQKDSEEDENYSDTDIDSQPITKKNLTPSHTRKKIRVSKDNSDSSSESDNEDREQKVTSNRSSTRLRSYRKVMNSTPTTQSPLPKRNKSSKTVKMSNKTPVRTPRQMTERVSTRSSRLQK